jgi:hypothetical protein
MFNKLLIATAMLVSCSTTVFAQADRSASEGGGFIGAYRRAVNHPTRGVCTAPQCRVVRPRQMPTGETEQAEAVQFLVAGARACLVDCSCEVQDAATPRYCVTEATPPSRPAPAATPAPAPAPRQVATPAPVAVTPVTPPVAANPPLPPYMPQSMFGSQTFADLGYCEPTMETISAFTQIGVFDATWYSSGARSQVMSMLAGQPAALGMMQSNPRPITLEFQMNASPYVMVISVNDREVVALRNGQPLLSVHQMRSGSHCVRGAIPAGSTNRFTMQAEGNSPTIDIEVSCYMPTPSGVIVAPIRTQRSTYNIVDMQRSGRYTFIDQADCGL